MSPRRQYSWDSNTLVLLNVRCRQFTKSYLSGALYKIPIRTGLDLGRKISIKILSVLMQKLGFQLYEIEFLAKQATFLLFRIGQILPGHILLFQVHCSKLRRQV